jgi:hypothetical protein
LIVIGMPATGTVRSVTEMTILPGLFSPATVTSTSLTSSSPAEFTPLRRMT